MTNWNIVKVDAVQTRDEISRLAASVRESGGNAIEFDLADVERMSTLMVQAIMVCARSCRSEGKGFRVLNLTDSAMRSLDLLGIDNQAMTSTVV